jgi:hypothetical protein
MEAGMHMDRFVVLQVENEWLVTYGDHTRMAFATREEAETSAFEAADAMASNGRAVSVLLMPGEADATPDRYAVLSG